MSGNDQNSVDSGYEKAMDALCQQDRIINEARMLPTDKPLTAEQIDEVRRAFTERMRASNLSMADVAKQVNYSGPVLSEWSSGKYNGNIQKVTRALNAWVNRESRRASKDAKKSYVRTRVAEQMRTIINLADSERAMCVIVGPSGCGKTLVLKAVQEELDGVYISLDEGMPPAAFLRRVAAHLGLPNGSRVKDVLHMNVVQMLRQTRRVIIIDEAQNLQTKTIATVRSLYDQSGVMIVMAGSADFLDRLDDRSDGRGQFLSRCICLNVGQNVANYDGPSSSNHGDHLFSIDEVRAFFARRSIRLDRDATLFLWGVSCQPGGGSFRILERIASIAGSDEDMRSQVLTRGQVIDLVKLIQPHFLRAILRYVEQHIAHSESTRPMMAATA